MKLKKFFAGVVAAAMMLTVGATAAFADMTDTSPQSEITITKKYTQNTDTTAPAENFYLQQTDKTIVHKSTTYSDAEDVPDLILTNARVEFTGAGEKDFTIKLPTYTDVGVFRYKVEEKADNGSIQGIDYQLKSYYVNVYSFRDDTTGNLYSKVTVTNIEGSQSVKVTDTTSEYDAGKLTVTKKVSGAMGDRNQDFIVKVTFTAANGKAVLSQINATTTRDGGISNWNVEVGNNVEVEGNAKAFTLKEGATATVSFNIKHNETVTFTNIPANVHYSVVENNYSSTAGDGDQYGYTTTYENEDSTTVAQDTKAAIVYNAKGGTIDTGVILDNAPYIALLAIVAIGGVALVLNKRRRDEE